MKLRVVCLCPSLWQWHSLEVNIDIISSCEIFVRSNSCVNTQFLVVSPMSLAISGFLVLSSCPGCESLFSSSLSSSSSSSSSSYPCYYFSSSSSLTLPFPALAFFSGLFLVKFKENLAGSLRSAGTPGRCS